MPPRTAPRSICFQELFYGPYFGITEDAKYYALRRTGRRPDRAALRRARQGAEPRHGAADLRGGAARRLLQHRGGGRRRRHGPRQVPQAPPPEPRQVLGEVLLPSRQPRLPGVQDRGRPDRGLHLLRPALPGGLARARPERRRRSSSTRTPPSPACRTGSGRSSSRRPPPPTATSSLRPTGSAARTTSTATSPSRSTASSQFVDPRGNLVGGWAAASDEEVLIRDLDLDMVQRDARRLAVLPRPPARLVHLDHQALIDADDDEGAHHDEHHLDHRRHGGERHRTAPADVLIDGETIAAVLAPGSQLLGTDLAASVDTRRSMRPASTSSPAASTRTPTWSCRSAAPRRPTPSRPAPGRRPGAARRRSSTSPCSATANGSRTAWPTWHAKAAGNCAIDYGFHQIIGGVDETRSRRWTRLDRRGHHELQAVHGLSRASSTPTTPRSSRRCRSRAETGLLTMMHAENGPAIDVLAAAACRGRARPTRTTTASPAPGRWRRRRPTARSCSPTSPGAPLYVVHVSAKQAVEQIACGPRQGPERLRRDLPAVPLPVARGAARRDQPGVGRLRGRQVGLLDAAALARGGPPGLTCGRRCARTTCRWSRPTTARSA